MSLVINHNLMAANTARNLNAHYGRLQTSTQRLSSGLRVNSAADDAAGLAIRELQRADIAALQQGARNANDAISMIQTADGALGVIDEKLIRMKELAEQAATGTYDSTQRLMIESEYQAMASEITRIANATDFNGMKLLDGTLSANEHDGSGMTATGKMKIHFGTGNDSAEDYYYITIGDCRAAAFGVGNESTWESVIDRAAKSFKEQLKVDLKAEDPVDLDKLAEVNTQVQNFITKLEEYSKFADGAAFEAQFVDPIKTEIESDMEQYWPSQAEFPKDAAAYDALSDNQKQKVQYAMGKAAMNLMTNHSTSGGTLAGPDLATPITQDNIDNAMQVAQQVTSGSDYAGYTIETQEDAQHALDAINNAIVSKDKIRAHLGATQNRLENTITNLNTQAENLQAAESRISDVDVATEMTQFVRNQILTQSAVAMLGQANSLPQMAMQLIGG